MCDSYCCRNRGYDGTCLATCRDITTIARALGARRCSYTRCPGRWKSRKSDHLGVGRLDHPLCFSVWSDSDAWITQMDGINHPSCLRNFGRAAGRFLSGHAHLRPVSNHSSNEIAATAPAMPAMQKNRSGNHPGFGVCVNPDPAATNISAATPHQPASSPNLMSSMGRLAFL